jgi:cell division protein FtsN
MQYAHWLMIAGTLLVMIGFVGLLLHKNAEPVEDVPEQEAPPEDGIVSGFAHQGPNRVSRGTDRADEGEAMSGQKRLAEQQVTDEASRKARNPMATRQKILEGQAAPEFQENRERLKAERLAREAELKVKK